MTNTRLKNRFSKQKFNQSLRQKGYSSMSHEYLFCLMSVSRWSFPVNKEITHLLLKEIQNKFRQFLSPPVKFSRLLDMSSELS